MIGEREGVMYDQARVSGSLKCAVIKESGKTIILASWSVQNILELNLAPIRQCNVSSFTKLACHFIPFYRIIL